MSPLEWENRAQLMADSLSPMMREALEHSPRTDRIGFGVTNKTCLALERRRLVVPGAHKLTDFGLEVRACFVGPGK